ncbi:hypothetical protein R5R35_004796 [Gryllus longicercus]|uniref:Glucosamine 6-phosphate N-acetyltransferase n=1 Tax=Gryllus longicercus TaxID=2509291 RepID=A0AAN9VQA8_9ORTH
MDPVKHSTAPDDEPLFDPDVLKKLDFSQHSSKLNPSISVMDPGPSLLVRPLYSSDYNKGILELLGQLTQVGYVDQETFLKRFTAMKKCSGTYYVIVIEDTTINKVVGAATLVVEQKFVHDSGLRGLLEDVVINDNYRGKQLGKLIVITVCLLAEHIGCYKITLNCKDKLIPFYQSLDFAFEPDQSNSCMTIRFSK